MTSQVFRRLYSLPLRSDSVYVELPDPLPVVWDRLANADDFLSPVHRLQIYSLDRASGHIELQVTASQRGGLWNRRLIARIQGAPEGAILTGRLSASRAAQRFASLFVVLTRLFTLLFLLGSLLALLVGDLAQAGIRLLGALAPAVLLVGLRALIGLSRRWSQPEERVLLRMLTGDQGRP